MNLPPPFTQDPQGNLVLQVQEGACAVLFEALDEEGDELSAHLGRLRFAHCWASEYVALSPTFALPLDQPCTAQAFLYELADSPWLAEKIAHRLREYPEWLGWDRRTYRHYVVSGHHNCCHVVATGFELDLVPRSRGPEGRLPLAHDSGDVQ
jgi:hypothetical protein